MLEAAVELFEMFQHNDECNIGRYFDKHKSNADHNTIKKNEMINLWRDAQVKHGTKETSNTQA
jgi:hypothetical protein